MELLDFLEAHKAQLEVIYLLSAPLMLVGVVVAWFQLMLLRRDLKAKYRRDSIKEVFKSLKTVSQIVNASLALENSLQKDGLWEKTPKVQGFDFSCFSVDCEWRHSFLRSESANVAIDLFNELEMLAQRILSGITDERYAYTTQGVFFLKLVDKHRAELAAHRISEQAEFFEAIVELYKMWSHRREREIEFSNLRQQFKKFLSMPRDKGKKIIQ